MTESSPWKLTATGCVVILLVQAVVVGLVLATGDREGPRLAAVCLAAAITGGGSLAGWFVARLSRRHGPGMAAAGGLAATALRLLPALAALAWLKTSQPAMGEAGLGGLLAGFFLAMLCVGIVLHLIETQVETGRPR